MEVHIATAISEPPPRSPIHILESSRAVQWCVRVCVLSCEGKPAVSVQLVWLHTWVGERPRCEARDRKGGGGLVGGIRADVIRESWSACQQWLAHAHTHTHTSMHLFSHTETAVHEDLLSCIEHRDGLSEPHTLSFFSWERPHFKAGLLCLTNGSACSWYSTHRWQITMEPHMQVH